MKTSLQNFEDYMLLEKKYSKHTIIAYINDLEDFETFVYQNYQVDLKQVEYVYIRNWIVHVLEQHVSNRSVNRKIASLKAFYKFLQKTKQIEKSPLAKHQALKTQKQVQVPFSETELQALVYKEQDLVSYKHILGSLIIEMLYTTGIRRSELINLQIQDLDLSNMQIKVLGKRNKQRIVPVLNELFPLIQKYISLRAQICSTTENNYLFILPNGKKINESFVYRLVNSYLSTVTSKQKKSPHMLRHTFATHLLNNGADLNSIKELLGHSSLASTQVYTQSSLSELKKIYKNSHPRTAK